MTTDPTKHDREHDRQHIGWTGSIVALKSLSIDDWPLRQAIADPSASTIGDLTVLPLRGFVTTSKWVEATAEIGRITATGCRGLVLWIDSPAQQEKGFDDFAQAVDRYRERRGSVAVHGDRLLGMGLVLAHYSDWLFATPQCPVGLLQTAVPFDAYADPKLELAICQTGNENLISRVCRRKGSPTWKVAESMVDRVEHAEQAERDWPKLTLSPDFPTSVAASAQLFKAGVARHLNYVGA